MEEHGNGRGFGYISYKGAGFYIFTKFLFMVVLNYLMFKPMAIVLFSLSSESCGASAAVTRRGLLLNGLSRIARDGGYL
jgi:hypothetical protein